MSRVFGEDSNLLARGPVPLAELERLEAAIAASAGGDAWDAHVHLGRDADGHLLGPGGLLADMERWGVASAVCFPANDPGPDRQFGAANAAVLQAARRMPERVVPFCRLDPRGDWRPALARAEAGGARGLKLHPVAQRFALDDPRVATLVAAATERGWPVTVHAGYGARPLAAAVDALLAEIPQARLILAHAGRGDARALAERLPAWPSVLLDTSLAALPDLVALPAERLVFGSDRPYGEHATALQAVALAAELAGWSPSQRSDVLGARLRRLLS